MKLREITNALKSGNDNGNGPVCKLGLARMKSFPGSGTFSSPSRSITPDYLLASPPYHLFLSLSAILYTRLYNTHWDRFAFDSRVY